MIQLEGEFRLCGESNKIIDRKNTCLKRNSNINQIATELVLNLNKTIRTTLLEKLHNQVSEEGYQCKREEIVGIFKTDIFGNKEEALFYYNQEELTDFECWEMIKERKCNGKDMQCDELLGCSLDDRPKEQYKWWSTKKIFGKKCSVAV